MLTKIPVKESLAPANAGGQPAEAETKVCPHCGGACKDGDKFCPQCGKAAGQEQVAKAGCVQDSVQSTDAAVAVPQPAKAAPAEARAAAHEPGSAPIKCVCGQVLPIQAKYCFACGLNVGQPACCCRLSCKTGQNSGFYVDVPCGDVTIGKSQDCDLIIDQDEYASRTHARLTVADDGMSLEDLGSTNGTFLRIKRPFRLEVGDEFLVGATLIRVEQV